MGAGARLTGPHSCFESLTTGVHVPAGATVSVYLYPALSEFAPVAPDGERRALRGTYRISVGLAETASQGMGYVTSELRAVF